jgi:hypothetical protein
VPTEASIDELHPMGSKRCSATRKANGVATKGGKFRKR